jgi:uncharacterized protein
MVALRVSVKPNARTSSLERAPDGTWVARLKSPPVDGKANAELIVLVADHFRCSRAAVRIKSGLSGRVKLLQIDDGRL